jgi:hypothetical protein
MTMTDVSGGNAPTIVGLRASARYSPYRMPAKNAAATATNHNSQLSRIRNRFMVSTSLSKALALIP